MKPQTNSSYDEKTHEQTNAAGTAANRLFTGRKEKRPPDTRDEGCTCVRMQVEHNVPEYAAKFLRPHNLKNRVSVYMEREVWDALQVIVKRIGGRELTTAGYIDNILREHLEAHKDRINEISRSHADIL